MAQIILRFGTSGKAKAEVTVNQITKAIDALAAKYNYQESDGAKAVFVAKKALSDILANAMIQEVRARQQVAVLAVQNEEAADLGAVVPEEEV